MAAQALQRARECEILSEVVEDAEAVQAVQRFLGECPCPSTPTCRALPGHLPTHSCHPCRGSLALRQSPVLLGELLLSRSSVCRNQTSAAAAEE